MQARIRCAPVAVMLAAALTVSVLDTRATLAQEIGQGPLEGAGEVVAVRGAESISRLFHYEVELASANSAQDLASALRRRTSVRIGGSQGRTVHGVITRLEVGEQRAGRTHYHVHLGPQAAALRHRTNYRMFQEKSVPEIVAQLLEEAGAPPPENRLEGSYAPRPLLIQYGESDWAFVSRLLEDEGIYFFFSHGASGDVLVLADRVAQLTSSGAVSYLGAASKAEGVTRFRYGEAGRSEATRLRDYDFHKPQVLLETGSPASNSVHLARYEYPGGFRDGSEGQKRADLRREELLTLASVGMGESRTPALAAGARVRLSGHHRSDLNREYVISEVVHATDSDGQYRNEFRCVPASVPFRPERVTPRPIAGLETATVTGPSGQEIHVDEFGRVKVRFRWDREGGLDGAHPWVRISQMAAGAKHGMIWLPRVGDEVLVGFEHGDPSRPFILGSLYNAQNVPPYTLPGGKTRSTIRAHSTPDTAQINEIRFENNAGQEELMVSAAKDLNVTALNDQTINVTRDRTTEVGRDHRLTVERNLATTINGAESTSVKGNRSISVTGAQTTNVSGAQTTKISGVQTTTVTKEHTMTIGGPQTMTVSGGQTMTVGGAQRTTVAGNQTTDVGGSQSTKIGVRGSVSAGKELQLKAASSIVLQVGEHYIRVTPSGIQLSGEPQTPKAAAPPKRKRVIKRGDEEGEAEEAP